ncbi:hypothetical protein TrRE_jg12920 [Triparma retinervis]|uniref:Uncharacterized protein n=1 Tax=Triparma retinervis TaxID=2557542 RepID=A0A9W6ZSZ6_9STRA|nr:hypothetical protein TrRE_jg12920 [Triparma retinervis]
MRNGREWGDKIRELRGGIEEARGVIDRAMEEVNRGIEVKERGEEGGDVGGIVVEGFWGKRIADFKAVEGGEKEKEKEKEKAEPNVVTDKDEMDEMDDADLRGVELRSFSNLEELCDNRDFKRERPDELHGRMFHLLVARHKVQVGAELLKLLEGQEGWDRVSKVVDADVDRAAMDGRKVDGDRKVRTSKLVGALHAIMNGASEDKLRAVWELHHKEDVGGEGGGIEREEMEGVVELYSGSVMNAVKAMGGRAIDTIPPAKGRDLGVVGTTKHKKRLRKAFDRVAKRLMDVEQEAPHRIRCIYQWADKEHQGGEFDAR